MSDARTFEVVAALCPEIVYDKVKYPDSVDILFMATNFPFAFNLAPITDGPLELGAGHFV
jgi:hypothetical protein